MTAGELRGRGAVLAGVVVYLVLLRWTYVERIAPEFAYLGYAYKSPPWWGDAIAFVLALLPAIWLPIGLRRPHHVTLWLLYVVTFIPAITVPQYSPRLAAWDVLPLSAGLTLSFAGLAFVAGLPPARLPVPRISVTMFAAIVGSLAVLFYGIVFQVFGLRLRPPSLSEVYDTRTAYKEIASASGGLVAYVMSWLAKVVNPLLISLGLFRRNLLLLGIGIMGQLVLYATAGLKGTILGVALLFGLAIAMGRGGRGFALWCVWGVVVLIAGSIALDLATSTRVFTSLFVRRLLVTPGLLTGMYFEFFGSHPKTELAYGIFSRLADYPYSTHPANLIGSVFIRDETSANANLWADGYAAFGVFGMLVFSLILGGLLWLYDSVARRVDRRVAVLLLGMPSMALANTALLTTLATHGLLLLIPLVYLLSGTTLAGMADDDPLAPSNRGAV